MDHATPARLLELNGTRLFVQEAGVGPAIILVHGFTLDLRMWDDEFQALADSFRVVRYDLRGFGRSTLPGTEAYSHADDLLALLDHLRIRRAFLMGLSMGGRVVVDFSLLHPERVSGIIAVDAVLAGYKFVEWNTAPVAQAAKDKGLAAAREAWLGDALFTTANARPQVAARLRTMVQDYSGWHWEHPNPWTALQPPTLERLGEIRAPTLVIVGQQDLPDFQRMADLLAQGIRGAQHVRLAGAGHMSNMEEPAAFLSAVRSFLQTLDPHLP
jgi:pimeloyl-ACP methyl ester carboxylesterase